MMVKTEEIRGFLVRKYIDLGPQGPLAIPQMCYLS